MNGNLNIYKKTDKLRITVDILYLYLCIALFMFGLQKILFQNLVI